MVCIVLFVLGWVELRQHAPVSVELWLLLVVALTAAAGQRGHIWQEENKQSQKDETEFNAWQAQGQIHPNKNFAPTNSEKESLLAGLEPAT